MTTEPVGDSTSLSRGRAALARGDWEEGVAALTTAVTSDPVSAEAWEALGNACMWLQDTERAIEARQRAYALCRERGDDCSSARLSLDLANDFFERGDMAVANGWFQRARRLLQEIPPGREHALLYIWDAYMALMDDAEPGVAEGHAIQAAAISARAGARDTGVLALALQGLACVTAGRVPEGMSLLDEAVAGAIGGEFSDPQWFYLTCCCMIDACDRVRDYRRSFEWCNRLRHFAERWRVQAFLTTCRIKYTGALLWRGDWKTCERELEHAIDELTAANRSGVAGAAVRLAELRRRQGRRREALALLERAGSHPLALAVRARLAADAGDAASAIGAADTLLRRTPPTARTERVEAFELKARAHASLGDMDAARAAVQELTEIARLVDTDALRATALAASALVAHPADGDQGRHRLEDAAHLFEGGGSPYEAARVRLDLARFLADRGQLLAASAEAGAALAILEPIGATAEVKQGRALLAALEPRQIPATSDGMRRAGPATLTRRQREILTLVAKGLSDRDIARHLTISEHTVHRHIANILTRLGVSSRSAAVAGALRGDLL